MNDNGAVAFAGGRGGFPAILVGDGGPVNAVVDAEIHTQFRAVLRPSINNAGAVAFMAQTTTTGYDSVVVAIGGGFVTIAGPGSPTPTIGTLTGAMEPTLNNHGVVAFIGQGASNFGLFTGNGGGLTTIVLSTSSTFAGMPAR